MTSESASYTAEIVECKSRVADPTTPIPLVEERVPSGDESLADTQDDSLILTSSSDEILFERLREGHQATLGVLFRRYARMVHSVAHRILRDAAEAEDLLQEVFLFIFRKAALFDAKRGSARSWIVQVTYHRAIDRRRHLASRRFYATAELDEALVSIEEPLTDTAFYERTIEGSLGTDMLRRIEEVLSDDQRKTLQLYFFEGHTFEEIAERIGQTAGNIRNHYYRALEKIRKLVFAKLEEK